MKKDQSQNYKQPVKGQPRGEVDKDTGEPFTKKECETANNQLRRLLHKQSGRQC